jgi:electron transfer flavoprotein alpha/beta subunit
MYSIKTLTVEICTDWDRFKFNADNILENAIEEAVKLVEDERCDQVVITEGGMIVAIIRTPVYVDPEAMMNGSDAELELVEVHRVPTSATK